MAATLQIPTVLTCVRLDAQWPNHGPETHFEGMVPLKVASGANITRAELAQWIALAVQTVIYVSVHGPPRAPTIHSPITSHSPELPRVLHGQ